MFNIIAIMALGIIVGKVLKNKKISFINNAISYLIWLLLFLLGISVGSNKNIIESIDTIGVASIVLSVSAVLGSVIAAWLVYKYIYNKL